MMYENIILLLIILCVVTLMYCKKEIMKYKNPSIIQQEYRRGQGMKEREDNVGCLDCDYYMMHVFGGHYHEDCLLSEPLHNPDCTKYKRDEVLISMWNKGPDNENMKEEYDKIKNFFEKI